MSKLSTSLLSFILCLSVLQSVHAQERTESLTVSERTPKKGEVLVSSYSETLNINTISTSPKGNKHIKIKQEQSNLHEDLRKIEILDVQKGQIVKVKVTFTRMTREARLNSARNKPLEVIDHIQPLNKRSFIVEKKANTWKIVESNKGNVSNSDLKEIKRTTASLFSQNANGIAQSISSKLLKTGAKIEIPEQALRWELGMYSLGFKFQERTLTFTGTKKIDGLNCAVFQVNYQGSHEERKPGFSITQFISGKGTLIVDIASGRETSLTLTGSLELESEFGLVSLRGKGQLSIRKTVTVQAARKSQ